MDVKWAISGKEFINCNCAYGCPCQFNIICGKDTEPGATVFQVFSTTVEKLHSPIFDSIEFEFDVDQRKARLVIPGVTDVQCCT